MDFNSATSIRGSAGEGPEGAWFQIELVIAGTAWLSAGHSSFIRDKQCVTASHLAICHRKLSVP